MNLAPTDRDLQLAAEASAAFGSGAPSAAHAPPPATATLAEACVVARVAGGVTSDRRHLVDEWARLLGWSGGGDVAVAFEVTGDHCSHVGRAGDATTLLVADPRGVAEVPLALAARTPRPTLFDADACRVELPAGWRDRARSHDVAGARISAMVLLAADCAGAAAAAFDAAVERTAQRPLRGGVLADLQVVRHRIADIAIAVRAIDDAVLDAAGRIDRGEPAGVTLAAVRAKALAVDHGRRVTADALRLAGGIGILEDHPWQRWYRRVKAAEPLFGSPRDHRAALGRAALARFR